MPVDSIKSILFLCSEYRTTTRKIVLDMKCKFLFYIQLFLYSDIYIYIYSEFVWFLRENHTETCFGSVLFHCQFETEIEMCSHILVKLPNVKCNENPFGGSWFFTCRQTDAQTYMVKLYWHFHNFLFQTHQK